MFSEHGELLDEAQCEVAKSMVQWKVFPVSVWKNEDGKESDEAKEAMAAAKAFKDLQMESTGKLWSEIGHTDKAYYVGYCRAGELASKAVALSGEYYRLNVALTAGYNLGRNWAETH